MASPDTPSSPANRPGYMLIGAVVFGVIAAFFAGVYIKMRGDAYLASLQEPEAARVAVVVANQDLSQGSVVSSDRMAVREIPEDLVSAGAITPDEFARVEGQVLVQPVREGTPLLLAFLEESFPLDFSDTLGEGRRAMTIQVDDLNSVGGLVRAGDHVDLYVLLPPEAGGAGGSQSENVVMPVLQDVKVLATGKEAAEDFQEKLQFGGEAPGTRFSNVTVDVTPRQAAFLTHATDRGDLVTLLRQRTDRGVADFVGIAASDLIGNARRMAAEGQVTTTKDGFIIAADGTVMTADGIVLEGVTVNENGEVVAADGTILRAKDIVLNDDGTISLADGTLVAGVTGKDVGPIVVNEDGSITTVDGELIAAGPSGGGITIGGLGSGIDFLAGGVSKDGVAEVKQLPILE